MQNQQSEETRLDRIEKGLELLLQGTLELKESQKKTDEQILELKEVGEQTFRKLEDLGRQLGDLGIVQGQVAEDLFYRNVRYIFKERNIVLRSIRRNLKKKGAAEYDIVAVDSDSVLVIEVKNKLEKRMVDSFINKRLPKFKKVFPRYSNYKLIGGIGALVIKDDVCRYAEKSGLYVLTQTADGGAALANRKNFRAKEFS